MKNLELIIKIKELKYTNEIYNINKLLLLEEEIIKSESFDIAKEIYENFLRKGLVFSNKEWRKIRKNKEGYYLHDLQEMFYNLSFYWNNEFNIFNIFKIKNKKIKKYKKFYIKKYNYGNYIEDRRMGLKKEQDLEKEFGIYYEIDYGDMEKKQEILNPYKQRDLKIFNLLKQSGELYNLNNSILKSGIIYKMIRASESFDIAKDLYNDFLNKGLIESLEEWDKKRLKIKKENDKLYNLKEGLYELSFYWTKAIQDYGIYLYYTDD